MEFDYWYVTLSAYIVYYPRSHEKLDRSKSAISFRRGGQPDGRKDDILPKRVIWERQLVLD